VLSGFLITGILLQSRDRPHYFRNFLAHRALRIFPLYYATIFVCLALLPLVPWSRFDFLRDLQRQQWWFWLHASNYYKILSNDPPVCWMSTLWSLAVEEHFYIVWPFLVWKLSQGRLARLCTLIAAGSLLLRLVLVQQGFAGDYIYRSTLTRLDPIVLGSLLAILARGPGGLNRLAPLARIVVPAAMLALLGQAMMRGGGAGRDNTLYGQTLQYSVVALLFGSVLVLVLTGGARSWWQRGFTRTPLVFLGAYSYALYILNKPCYALVKMFFNPDQWPVLGSRLPAALLFVILGSVLAVAGSQLTWHLLEKRCLGLKRYFEVKG